MFHEMRNIGAGGTEGRRGVAESVRRRLPPGWSADFGGTRLGGQGVLLLKAADGRRAKLSILSRKRVIPREVPHLVQQFGDGAGQILLVAPFIGERSRQLLAESGVSYADGTGNLRLVVSNPAIFLEGQGADRDPDQKPRNLRSLKGAAAGRVVRALCDFLPPYGVRTLAVISSTPLGTVSRVVSFLEDEALLARDAKKQIASVDWAALIARWARDYGVQTSNRLTAFLEPRGLAALAPKLARLDRYCVTGSMAGPGIAPARLAMVYVDDAILAAQTLGLVPADAGANVWLLEPADGVVFERTRKFAFGASAKSVMLVAAASTQVAVDLMTSPGRGPQEAEALIEKMRGSEDAWRWPSRP